MMLNSFIALSLMLTCGLAAPQNSLNNRYGAHSAQQSTEIPMDIRELASGNHFVTEPFVLVVRDSETYQALKSEVNQLLDMPADFFQSNAVVAAFLGQRRTSAYRIEIKRGAGGEVQITEHAPPKDAMVKMVLSSPFRIVAIPYSIEHRIPLLLDEAWTNSLKRYEVTSGELSVSGGFAGVDRTSPLKGTIGVMHEKSFATITFDLHIANEKEPRHVRDSASTVQQNAKEIRFTDLDAYGLTQAVHRWSTVVLRFTADRTLLMNLQSNPPPLASDAYSANATVTASVDVAHD